MYAGFIVTLSVILAVLYRQAFRVLPHEGGQFVGAVPVAPVSGGRWQARPVTYYGVFMATGCAVAIALFVVLQGAVGNPPLVSLGLILLLLGFCLAMAAPLARWVERRRHVFTVGGAACVGILLAPWFVMAGAVVSRRFGMDLQVLPTLAALAVVYALGEGIGRLACVSFGCCYGRPASTCPAWLRKGLHGWTFAFRESTRKAVYDGGLQDVPLIPIQAITATVLTTIAMVGTYGYLHGHFRMVAIGVLVGVQGWRFVSEYLRADDRGSGRWSAYQIMGLAGIGYSIAVISLIPPDNVFQPVSLIMGISRLWDPAFLLLVQAGWWGILLYTGLSSVTGAELVFFPRQTHSLFPAASRPEPASSLQGPTPCGWRASA